MNNHTNVSYLLDVTVHTPYVEPVAATVVVPQIEESEEIIEEVITLLPNQAPKFLTPPQDFELILEDLVGVYEHELPPVFDLNQGDSLKLSIENFIEIDS